MTVKFSHFSAADNVLVPLIEYVKHVQYIDVQYRICKAISNLLMPNTTNSRRTFSTINGATENYFSSHGRVSSIEYIPIIRYNQLFLLKI